MAEYPRPFLCSLLQTLGGSICRGKLGKKFLLIEPQGFRVLVDCTRPGWTKGVLTHSKLISCILGYSFFVPFEGWSVCLVSLWFVTVYAGSDTELWPSTFSSHGIGQYHCFQLVGQLCMNLNKGSLRHHLIIVSIGRFVKWLAKTEM